MINIFHSRNTIIIIKFTGNPVANPDPQSGLYVKKRNGQGVQVKIPQDYLGFQIGETSQVHAGGNQMNQIDI